MKKNEPQRLTISCSGSSDRFLTELEAFQGELKTLGEKEYAKLRRSMLEHGFVAPLFVWDDKILDGHQRLLTVKKMIEDGDIADPVSLPVVDIKAKDEKTAKKLVLVYSSAYGRMSEDSLYEYIKLNDLNVDDLFKTIDLPTIDLGKFAEGYLEDEPSTGEDAEKPKVNKLGEIKDYCTKVVTNNSDDELLVQAMNEILAIVER